MKSIITAFLMAGLLALVGCGKKAPPTPPPFVINDVKVDIPKLQAALQNAPPEVQTEVRQVAMQLRYRQYEKTLMVLDGLANNAAVTDEQKKVVNEVIEEMKQVIQKAPAGQ